jgi:amidase
MKNDLVSLSAIEQRALIGQKELSPVELLDAHIERMQAINPGVNALCATDFKRARTLAKAAEKAVRQGQALGPLHGLPIGIKDLTETEGLLTTFGNTGFTHHVPKEDNALVRRIKAAGGIIAAKTNTPDMGAGANTRNQVWGATGNPFNPALNAGGSSGGSAAALATEMLPLCTGSDVGGSLRIPAAMCGVVGIRPSPGMISQSGRKLGWSVLNVVGPMARNVADTALLFSACMGPEPLDPLAFPSQPGTVWPMAPIDLSRLRIGYTEDFGCCVVDAMTRAVFRQRISALTKHVSVCEPVELALGDADRAFDVMRAEGFLAQMGEQFAKDASALSPNVRANMEIAQAMTLGDRAWAHLQQTHIMQAFAKSLMQYDLILSPVTPVTPFPWEMLYADKIDGQTMRNYYHWLALTYVVTLSTHPALSLPSGVDEAGMPFGLQLIAPLYQDGRLLAMAHALETVLAADPLLARPKPDLSALHTPNATLTSIVTHPPGPFQ